MNQQDTPDGELEQGERETKLRDAQATVEKLNAELVLLRESERHARRCLEETRAAQVIALSELERRITEWEELFKAIPVSLAVYDHDGKTTQSNEFRNKEGRPKGVAADSDADRARVNACLVKYPDGWEVPVDQTAQRLAVKDSVFVQNMLYHTEAPNGGVRHKMVSAVPLVGSSRRVLVMSQDVTEIDKARLMARLHSIELERLALQWRTVLQRLSDAVFVWDESGTLILVNDAGLRLAGADSIDDYKPSAICSPDGRPLSEEERPIQRARRGESFQDMYLHYTNAKGKKGEALVSGGPIDTPLGRIAFTVWHDVTEQKRLEKVKDDFLQVVAHEVKNPLQVMKGVVQVARLKQDLDERTVKHLRTLETQIDLTTGILTDLIGAAKVTHSSFSLIREPVSLDSILEDALTPFVTNPSGRNLHVAIHESLGTVLQADRMRVVEVLTNLLSNAIKYTQHDGNIWVQSHVDERNVTISVADDGTGIAEDELEKVFQGFYRSKRLSDWGATGLGLGLYISRSIARSHGGDLHAENRPGCGTVMVLRLPLDQHVSSPHEYSGVRSESESVDVRPTPADVWNNTDLLARIQSIRDELSKLIESGKTLNDPTVVSKVGEIDRLSIDCVPYQKDGCA